MKETTSDGFTIYRDEDGNLHREDGPAVTDYHGEYEAFFRHGRRHREDGPAVIDRRGHYEEWWVDGDLHREDGPAVNYHDEKFNEFWHHGIEISEDRLGIGPEPLPDYLVEVELKLPPIYEDEALTENVRR